MAENNGNKVGLTLSGRKPLIEFKPPKPKPLTFKRKKRTNKTQRQGGQYRP